MAEITPLTVTEGVHQLRTEAFVAEELRNAAEPLLKALCAVMDDAAKNGLIMNFRIDKNALMHHHVGEVSLVKPL